MNKITKIKKIILEEYNKIISEQQEKPWYEQDSEFEKDPWNFYTMIMPGEEKLRYPYITITDKKGKKYTRLITSWQEYAQEKGKWVDVNTFLQRNKGYFSDKFGNSLNDRIKLWKRKSGELAAKELDKVYAEKFKKGLVPDYVSNKKVYKIGLEICLSTEAAFGSDEELLTKSIESISNVNEFELVNEFLRMLSYSKDQCYKQSDFAPPEWLSAIAFQFAETRETVPYIRTTSFGKGKGYFDCVSGFMIERFVPEFEGFFADWLEASQNVLKHGYLATEYIYSDATGIWTYINEELSTSRDKEYLERIRTHLMKILPEQMRSHNQYGHLVIHTTGRDSVIQMPVDTKYVDQFYTQKPK